MFVDFRQWASNRPIEADICIIGAGAAGIAIARRFIHRPVQVCVLESGHFEIDEATQRLYGGANVGLPYFPLEACRLRYFGGTMNHWAGHCGIFLPSDFEAREWIPHSGWPISFADVEPFYQAAHALCDLDVTRYDEATWSSDNGAYPPLDGEKVQVCFWQFSIPPTNFGQKYREELEAATNVRVYLNANATRLDLTPSADHVRSIEVRAFGGNRAEVHARQVILACGGIENARLLLASRNVIPAGVGNTHDLVGRFFMEHPHVRTATVVTRAPAAIHRFAERFQQHGAAAKAGFRLTEAAQRRERVLNYAADIRIWQDPEPGYLTLRGIIDDLKTRSWPAGLRGRIARTITDLDDVIRGAASRLRGTAYAHPTIFVLVGRSEQAPNPSSRVTLDDAQDALGSPRTRLEWHLSPIDKRTIRRATILIGEELARLGIARIRLEDWLLADDTVWPGALAGGRHHMGTTRMADAPTDGVVDRQCRVHGIDNLYVAGSSVFATSSYINPTVTLLALALRLADHLAARV